MKCTNNTFCYVRLLWCLLTAEHDHGEHKKVTYPNTDLLHMQQKNDYWKCTAIDDQIVYSPNLPRLFSQPYLTTYGVSDNSIDDKPRAEESNYMQ